MDAIVEQPEREFDVYVRQEITIELPRRRIRAKTLEEAERIGMMDAIVNQMNNSGQTTVTWKTVACAA